MQKSHAALRKRLGVAASNYAALGQIREEAPLQASRHAFRFVENMWLSLFSRKPVLGGFKGRSKGSTPFSCVFNSFFLGGPLHEYVTIFH